MHWFKRFSKEYYKDINNNLVETLCLTFIAIFFFSMILVILICFLLVLLDYPITLMVLVILILIYIIWLLWASKL